MRIFIMVIFVISIVATIAAFIGLGIVLTETAGHPEIIGGFVGKIVNGFNEAVKN